MSVQQAASHGAKSHLGPYAISQGLIPTVCTDGTVLKKAASMLSVPDTGELRLRHQTPPSLNSAFGKALLKAHSVSQTESNNRPLPA